MESVEKLRARAEAAERQLLAREVADAQARTERIEREQKEAETKAAADRDEVRKAELERMRQGAWVNHKLTALQAAGRGEERLSPDALDSFVPADGSWPPGHSADQYALAGLPYVAGASDEAASTPMGKRLSEMLERAERGRRARGQSGGA